MEGLNTGFVSFAESIIEQRSLNSSQFMSCLDIIKKIEILINELKVNIEDTNINKMLLAWEFQVIELVEVLPVAIRIEQLGRPTQRYEEIVLTVSRKIYCFSNLFFSDCAHLFGLSRLETLNLQPDFESSVSYAKDCLENLHGSLDHVAKLLVLPKSNPLSYPEPDFCRDFRFDRNLLQALTLESAPAELDNYLEEVLKECNFKTNQAVSQNNRGLEKDLCCLNEEIYGREMFITAMHPSMEDLLLNNFLRSLLDKNVGSVIQFFDFNEIHNTPFLFSAEIEERVDLGNGLVIQKLKSSYAVSTLPLRIEKIILEFYSDEKILQKEISFIQFNMLQPLEIIYTCFEQVLSIIEEQEKDGGFMFTSCDGAKWIGVFILTYLLREELRKYKESEGSLQSFRLNLIDEIIALRQQQPRLILDSNELKAIFSLFCRFVKDNYFDDL